MPKIPNLSCFIFLISGLWRWLHYKKNNYCFAKANFVYLFGNKFIQKWCIHPRQRWRFSGKFLFIWFRFLLFELKANGNFYMLHEHIVWKLLKMSHLNFGVFHQFLSCFKKLTCLVALFDRKLQIFRNSPKLNIIWHF